MMIGVEVFMKAYKAVSAVTRMNVCMTVCIRACMTA